MTIPDDEEFPDEPRKNAGADEDTVIERKSQRLEDYVPQNYCPLIDGASVGISPRQITLGEIALDVDLPDCPPPAATLRPIADTVSDEAIAEEVEKELKSLPLIATMLYVSKLLSTASKRGQQRLERQFNRALTRQQSLPSNVPRQKGEPFSVLRFVADLTRFWANWAGLALAGFAAALGVALIIENLAQVFSFQNSDWAQAQNFWGAFGVTYGFTLGSVGITSWRRKVQSNPDCDQQTKSMAEIGFYLVWVGLATMGFIIGTLHPKGAEDYLLIYAARCVLTTSMTLTLGILCVALEWFTEASFRSAMSWIEIPNSAIEELEDYLHSRELGLATIDQIGELASALERRIKEHIDSQTPAWLSLRDVYRRENQEQRDAAMLRTKISNLASQLRQAQDALGAHQTGEPSTTSSY